ncbi:hypothetical protein J1N35_013977 [Gossypium stocksii]|uniref:DUF4218 domain-containing protein n=1 Tax=Gossypium stocksii TaxID=47602 RepID=A0A9D4A9A6_9ROSI|nr:hypothetical protein J1N35_013977 [Gossypium stocksii]
MLYIVFRFLSKLKSYCRNKRYPEGSIAEGYLAEECMTFYSRYLEDVETRLNRPSRNAGLNDPNLAETYLFQSYREPIDKVEIAELDDRSWIQAHRYVLFRHDVIEPSRNARDSNPVEGNVEHYGLLTDIIDLDYYGKWKVVLFRCDWADVNTARGIKMIRKMPRRRLRDFSIVQNTTNSKELNSEQQTIVGSSSVPETLDESAEYQIIIYYFSSETGGMHRGQGRTLLKYLNDLTPVERVKVTRNCHGQPVGPEARLFIVYLGIVARNANMLPINYESWHNIPDSNKNQALDNIKERFALEVSDAYVKKALGKKWRDHKSNLKKEYFKKPITLKEKLQNVPPGMLRIVSELEQAAGKNKNSRTRQGREEASSGQKVGRLQLFDITHRKKDGSPITSEAGEIMEKLKEKKAKYEASTDSSTNFGDIDDKIINEVVGPERYGWVRFQGSSVNPTQYFGSSSQEYMLSGSQSQAEVQRLKDQIAQMQASIVEQISQLKAEAKAREAQMQASTVEQISRLKAEVEVRGQSRTKSTMNSNYSFRLC